MYILLVFVCVGANGLRGFVGCQGKEERKEGACCLMNHYWFGKRVSRVEQVRLP